METEGSDLLVYAANRGEQEPRRFRTSDIDWKQILEVPENGHRLPLRLYLDEEAIPLFEAKANALPPFTKLHVVDQQGHLWAAWVLPHGPAKNKIVVSIRPGVLLRCSGKRVLSGAKEAIRWRLPRQDLTVLSLFDAVADRTTLQALQQTIGSTGVRWQNVSRRSLNSQFVTTPGGTCIVFGHAEQNGFAIRDQRGRSISIVTYTELLQSAEQNNVSLILLGCRTAMQSDVTGLLTDTNSLELAKRLDAAIRCETYGDFLGAIGSAESPLVVTESILEQGRHRLNAVRELPVTATPAELLGITSVRTSVVLTDRDSTEIMGEDTPATPNPPIPHWSPIQWKEFWADRASSILLFLVTVTFFAFLPATRALTRGVLVGCFGLIASMVGHIVALIVWVAFLFGALALLQEHSLLLKILGVVLILVLIGLASEPVQWRRNGRSTSTVSGPQNKRLGGPPGDSRR